MLLSLKNKCVNVLNEWVNQMDEYFFEDDLNGNIYNKKTGDCILKRNEYEKYTGINGYLLVQTKGARRLNRLYDQNGEFVYRTGDDNIEVVVTKTAYGIRQLKEGEGFMPMMESLKENLDEFKFYPLPYQKVGKCFVIHDEGANLFYLCQKKNNHIIATASDIQIFEFDEEKYVALKDEKTNLWTLYDENGCVEPEIKNVSTINKVGGSFVCDDNKPVLTKKEKSEIFWDRLEHPCVKVMTTLICVALCLGGYYGCTEKAKNNPVLINKAPAKIETKKQEHVRE